MFPAMASGSSAIPAVGEDGPQATPVHHAQPPAPQQDGLLSSAQAETYEATHVHAVYEAIAPHFSATRHKPWPFVAQFLNSQPPGSVGFDVGCGNGKYLRVNRGVHLMGSDRSAALVRLAWEGPAATGKSGGDKDAATSDGRKGNWAFEGEKIIHGRPSGIDNTVSTFGNMIMFRSGSLTRIKPSFQLRMLITNTKVGRNTKALVAGVSERTSRHPDAMASAFSAVDSISKELSNIIQSPAPDEIALTEKEEKLEELMEMNQGLLQCMGVSHASIETVLRTTLKYKLASKLTGAGGGGCVLTFLPTLVSQTVVDKVMAELESCGFQCLTAEIGGEGLEICFDGSS